MRVICFHNPDEENGYLSNWYPLDFTVDNIRFSSMEQYMMYKKAVLFNDTAIAEEIMKIDDPALMLTEAAAVQISQHADPDRFRDFL